MNKNIFVLFIALLSFNMCINLKVSADISEVERFGFFEAAFKTSVCYSNPYTELNAEAELKLPEGSIRIIPLFWDGAHTWRLRVSPDIVGKWSFKIHSPDNELDGKSGSFICIPSNLRGSIQPMKEFPNHFQYQNGEPLWFMGETAWALFTDNLEEKHNRKEVEKFLKTRASQGFNVVHSMVLSEAGWGNSGDLPFEDMEEQIINPGYWQEMDYRVKYANHLGIVVGLVLAWGDKNKSVPFPWRMFPDLKARKQYARFIAARYSAYNVYFIVSGEWHGEVHTRPGTEAEMKMEFIEIGDALDKAEPHGRMIGIHPMTSHGSVREYNDAGWMSFGDYQQNYRQLHSRLLESIKFKKPVVNSEYGYYLRDQNGDGTPDKDNSTSLESIRHASWDIAMAGGYYVTGFGTTYYGGYRDPGPFNVDAAKNDDWEMQIGFIKKFFTGLDWWKLVPKDEWLTCRIPRGKDGKQFGRAAPPAATYWLLADSGKHYLLYSRGLTDSLILQLGQYASGKYRIQLLNPRTGAVESFGGESQLIGKFTWIPPDKNDWILHLVKQNEGIQ